MAKPKKPKIDPADDDFGAVLNCAVRYACGRRTYMPGTGCIWKGRPTDRSLTRWAWDR